MKLRCSMQVTQGLGREFSKQELVVLGKASEVPNSKLGSNLGDIRTVRKPASGRLLPISVQLAFARQCAKEQGESDDGGRRSDDSYSPRRHWRFRSPTIS